MMRIGMTTMMVMMVMVMTMMMMVMTMMTILVNAMTMTMTLIQKIAMVTKMTVEWNGGRKSVRYYLKEKV